MGKDIRWVKTHCARMDHGGCALLVGVRDGRIVQVKGDPEGYLSRDYNSSYRWLEKLRKSRPHPRLEINPETVKKYGISDGDEVVIKTQYGRITQVSHVTDCIDPRVVSAAHGWWFPEGKPGTQFDWEKSNFNMLTSTGKLGREYGTPNLKSIPCRIVRKI